MIPRRQLLGLAIVGGAAGAVEATAAATPSPELQITDRSVEDIGRAIDSVQRAVQELRTTISSEAQAARSFGELRAIREAQREHLVITGKWPDYIEVGYNVWMSIHDWHIRWQQPMSMGRDTAGRFTLLLMGTALIMRTDQLPNYIGPAYDNRPQV